MTAGGNHYRVPYPIALMFAEDFPSKHEIEQAAEWWNLQAGQVIFVDADVTPGATIAYLAFDWDTPEDPAHPGVGEAALTRSGTVEEGRVTFDEVILYGGWLTESPSVRQSVARHELGHVLSLDHSASPECLMFWQVQDLGDKPMELCPEEIALLKKVVMESNSLKAGTP